MLILNIAIIIFIIMESLNVLVLYFNPKMQIGNGVGIFNGFHQSQKDENEKLFVKYLINWIANAKVIFIVLLLVILFTGTEIVKLYTCIGMVLSITLYFISLHPIIKNLDEANMITPKGYSKGLGIMIAGFMVMFTAAIVIYFIKMH